MSVYGNMFLNEASKSMNDNVYQKIFDMIDPFLPDNWRKMILFVGYTEGSYTMKYYTSDSEGKFADCFEQPGSNKSKLVQLFVNIDKVLSHERKKLDEKNKWTVMTMTVSSSGSIKTSFDYTDISEDAIKYEQKWKEKYIK